MESAMSERKWKVIGAKRRASATVTVERKGAINIKI